MREAVHNRARELGFKVFGESPPTAYDMNVIGLRRMPPTPTASTFDDLVTVSYRDGRGVWNFHAWPATTDPGGKYLAKPINPSIGTAVLVSNAQYPRSHKLGVHGASKPWAHEALVQVGTLRVWHDNDRDDVVDYGLAETVSRGTSGINIHRHLGDFSAGCQVFRDRADFDSFIAVVKKQIAAGLGDLFTYTLLEWSSGDFPPVAKAFAEIG